jgi:hypothetical protein
MNDFMIILKTFSNVKPELFPEPNVRNLHMAENSIDQLFIERNMSITKELSDDAILINQIHTW